MSLCAFKYRLILFNSGLKVEKCLGVLVCYTTVKLVVGTLYLVVDEVLKETAREGLMHFKIGEGKVFCCYSCL